MKSTSLAALSCAVATSMTTPAHATPLGDAAQRLQPGEWTTLESEGIVAALEASGASGMIFGYTDDAQWDPNTRQLFFIGGDHNDVARFVAYSDDDNAWTVMQQPYWIGSNTMHGYDHSALDPATSTLFHRPFGSPNVYRYDIGGASWSEIASVSGAIDYIACCAGMDFFPELGGLVYASVENGNEGSVIVWDAASDTWTSAADGLVMNGVHFFAEYNPVHQLTIFGGGEGDEVDGRNVYVIDAAGEVTQAPTQAPTSLGPNGTIITVDPNSGEYLVFTNDKELYTYDVITDTWLLQPGAPPILDDGYDKPVHGLVAAPIATYGVVLFVECDGSDCSMHVYRHSPGSSTGPSGAGGGAQAGAGGGAGSSSVTGGAGGAALEPRDGAASGCACRGHGRGSNDGPWLAFLVALGCVGARRRRMRHVPGHRARVSLRRTT